MSDNPTQPAKASATRLGGARRSTVVVMLATLLTKVVGLVREVLVAAYFGAAATMSAFTVAFQIPNVIRTFVADQALVSSLVPVFTKLREEGEEERAWRVASTIVSILLILLVPLTMFAMVFAEFFVDLVVHDHFEQMALAVDLFRIMIPVVVLMSIGGVIIGILNSYGRFGPPAFAQLAFNAVAILVLVVGVEMVNTDKNIYVYAIAVLVATIIQVLLPMPWLRGTGNRLSIGRSFADPAVRAVVVAMLPVMLSLAMLNLNNIVNTYWSTRVPLELLEGVVDSGPATIYKAFGVFQLPQGIFSLAVATVFFPLFARHSARGDIDKFREAVGASIRQIIVLLMPATVFMYVLAEPIVELLFERGEFSRANTIVVAAALQGFAIGLVANGAIQLLMRAFFSIRAPWVPAIVGFLVNLLGNIVLGGLLHAKLGVFGITLSMAIANTASFLVLWFVLRNRVGNLGFRSMLQSVLLSLAASAFSMLIGYYAWKYTLAVFSEGLIGSAIAMMIAIGVTWGLYAVLALKLRLVNVPALRSALKRDR